mmetsp:Transcript_54841/g.146379  ORF Transcript_54841/g.146379 Transcript_54841/m.146379 type:complete len:101 (+) Transcript_54841:2889-3191(+)
MAPKALVHSWDCHWWMRRATAIEFPCSSTERRHSFSWLWPPDDAPSPELTHLLIRPRERAGKRSSSQGFPVSCGGHVNMGPRMFLVDGSVRDIADHGMPD